MNDSTAVLGTTVNGWFVAPVNHNVTGTCGKCGGPIISPMIWSGGDSNTPIPEWCYKCGAHPKPAIPADYGPVKEME